MDSEKWRKKKKQGKIFLVLGSIFMNIFVDVEWYWGNMSVYVLSYLDSRDASTSEVDASWTLSLYLAFWSGGILANGALLPVLGRKLLLLMGSTIAITAMFMNYFSLQHSLTMVSIDLGVFGGIGSGLLYGSTIKLMAETADNDFGLLSSLLLGSYSMGGIIISPVTSWYINNENVSPDLILRSKRYFTQRSVLDRVSSVYLLLGGILIMFHVIGFSLISIGLRKTISIRDDNSASSLPNNESSQTEHQPLEEIRKNNSRTFQNSPGVIENKENCNDHTPKEMIKSPVFYTLWISLLFAYVPDLALVNFYKLYGQLWIHNDHFLTYVGIIYVSVTIPAKILCGMAVDRFGPKPCLITILSTTTVSSSWFYFSPMVHESTFVIVMLIYGAFASIACPCITASATVFFGRTHATTNIGLIYTAIAIVNLIFPLAANGVFEQFGWFALFAGSGGLTLLCLILCLILIPRVYYSGSFTTTV